MYVDYAYYSERGTLSEEDFDKVIDKAEAVYNNYTRKPELTNRYLTEDGEFAKIIKLTICELVDNLHKASTLIELAEETDQAFAQGITSESVASHSVSFASDSLKSRTVKKQLQLANAEIIQEYLGYTGLLSRGL